MTREEAIEIIKREFAMDEDVEELYPEVVEARDMAISALEQQQKDEDLAAEAIENALKIKEPCEDTISINSMVETIATKATENTEKFITRWMQDHDRQMTEMGQPSRKGHWITTDHIVYKCSECETEIKDMPKCMSEVLYDYCPYCGADMRESEVSG